MSDHPIDDLELLQRADADARARLALPPPGAAPRAPGPLADPAFAAIERVRVAAEGASSALAERESAERTVDEERGRARLAARTIPGGRAWARFDSPELEARVPSKQARAASRRAVGAPWVVWHGPAGSGKTSLACAALAARIGAGACSRPMFVSGWKLGRARMLHPLGEGEPAVVEQAMRADLLVLDDVTEGHCPTSAVLDVIFEREAQGRATWFTTWAAPGEGDAVAKLLGDGIARRVWERALVIDCAAGVKGGAGR